MAGSIVLRGRSPADTDAVARAVARLARGGDVMVLTGDLGAGKTAFTKALAAALGVTAPVTSPTFTLANRYEGALTVHHLDVYRLGDLAEVRDLGLDELIGPDSLTVVEWGDTIAAALPGDLLEVDLTLPDPAEGLDDDHRVITLTARGPSWAARLDRLVDDPGLRPLAVPC
jgi:tRNA threonylcarbamoyladenosine biosynthesis protein TsaE